MENMIGSSEKEAFTISAWAVRGGRGFGSRTSESKFTTNRTSIIYLNVAEATTNMSAKSFSGEHGLSVEPDEIAAAALSRLHDVCQPE